MFNFSSCSWAGFIKYQLIHVCWGTLCTDPAIAVNLMAHQSIRLKVVNVLKLSLYSR